MEIQETAPSGYYTNLKIIFKSFNKVLFIFKNIPLIFTNRCNESFNHKIIKRRHLKIYLLALKPFLNFSKV